MISKTSKKRNKSSKNTTRKIKGGIKFDKNSLYKIVDGHLFAKAAVSKYHPGYCS